LLIDNRYDNTFSTNSPFAIAQNFHDIHWELVLLKFFMNGGLFFWISEVDYRKLSQ